MMKTGILLEELISIAQKPKTDFALSMHMTPSGLSKILTGKRLPFQKEKKMFSKQAASFFSETIYSYKCYMRFWKIFPVIYDFSSKYELELFLTHAIEYALDKDFSSDNNEDFDSLNQQVSFLGAKTSLNMFCILVSDPIAGEKDIPLEFYSALPMFGNLYPDIFQRIKIISPEKRTNLFLHQSKFESCSSMLYMGMFSSIAEAQQYADLNLWTTKEPIEHSFLLLKGRFLILFTMQMDGTPLMTVITHKGYLVSFYNSLLKKGAEKSSFTRGEAVAALQDDAAYMDMLLNKGLAAVYNFISIGHLVKKEDLDKIGGNETIKAWMLKIFQSILTKGTSFCVTIDAMMSFAATGKAIVPLVGTVDIPPEERISYLSRYDAYLDNPEKVIVLNCEMPKVAVFHFPGLSVIYLIDNEYSSEKFHLFKTDKIHNILASEIANGNLKTLPFSYDLWAAYIMGLSDRR